MDRTSRGFTLFELLVATACFSLLACLAVPAYSSARAAVDASRARAALVETLRDAVRHSSRASQPLVLCPRSGSESCTGTPNWSAGWIGFMDSNANRSHDSGERRVIIVGPLPGSARIVSTEGRTRLVFQPSGGNAGSNVTFTLCDSRGPSKATAVILANDGRLRAATPTATAAARCGAG